jgi:hypothetical protein
VTLFLRLTFVPCSLILPIPTTQQLQQVADPSTHLYNIKLDDGRDVKKAKLGGIHAPPPVGTEVRDDV